MKVLGLGIDGPARTPMFFNNTSPAAQVALLTSSITTSTGGSITVPDATRNVSSTPAFVRAMMADLRSTKPFVPKAYVSGLMDVRMFRVNIEQCTVGIHVKPSVTAPTLSVNITSPSSGQTLTGSATVSAAALGAATVQYKLDGNNLGSPLGSP